MKGDRKRPSGAPDGFIRGFGCCASVTIMLVGAVIVGIMIGLGLKDAKLIKVANELEAPVRSSDLQNIFSSDPRSNVTYHIRPNASRYRAAKFSRSRKSDKTNVTSLGWRYPHAIQTYKFERAKLLCSKLRNEIHNSWQIDKFPEFKKTVHIPKAEWETYKQKFQHLLTHASNKTKFIIAFGGSSVTAGHDNYLNESYPAIVEKQLKPIFDLLGVQLSVLNAAIGNNPCYPYDMCMESHIPPDVDMISWEQSLNCGRDPEPIESFLRTSAMSRNRPMVMLMSSGTPYWEPKDCDGVDPSPPQLTAVENREASLPLDVLSNQSSILWNFHFLNAGGNDLAKNLANYYSHVVPISAQNLNGLAVYKCKGPYGPDFAQKTLGKGKSWHPGVKGHQLRADSFSYFMTSILSSALTEYIPYFRASRGKTLEYASKISSHIAKRTWQIKTSPLPKPLVCSPLVCRQSTPPKCLTMIQPQFTLRYNMKKFLVVPDHIPEGWTSELSWMDVNGVAKAVSENRGYLDKKIIFMSDSNTTSPIEFSIIPSQTGVLWLCQVPRGFLKYPDSIASLDTGAIVTITPQHSGKMTSRASEPKVLTMKKVSGENECFQSAESFDKGRSILSIRKRDPSKRINIAYIVYW